MTSRTRFTSLAGTTVAAFVLAAAALSGTAQAQGPTITPGPPPFIHTHPMIPAGGIERHPRLRAAMNNLQRIENNLSRDPYDFHGHKVRAMQLINQAIGELNQAISSDQH